MILNEKILSKIQKTKVSEEVCTLNNTLVFISIDSPDPCPKFINVLEFFPTDSLRGTLFDQSDFEVLQIKLILVTGTGMHR